MKTTLTLALILTNLTIACGSVKDIETQIKANQQPQTSQAAPTPVTTPEINTVTQNGNGDTSVIVNNNVNINVSEPEMPAGTQVKDCADTPNGEGQKLNFKRFQDSHWYIGTADLDGVEETLIVFADKDSAVLEFTFFSQETCVRNLAE